MEAGGTLFSSTSWLEFFGPGRVPVEVKEVVVLEEVVVPGVVEVAVPLVVEEEPDTDVVDVALGPEVDAK
jgi:hypothetical protein